MNQAIHLIGKLNDMKFGRIPFYFVLVVFVFLLAILQDFIYSRIQNTGFYISESALYNCFWIFFVPITLVANRLLNQLNPKNKLSRLPLNFGIGIAFSFIHLLFFTSLFVLISNLVFSPAHRFISIFKTAFSNQFYIALLWYTLFPIIYIAKLKPKIQSKSYSEKLKLKVGTKIIAVPSSSIQLITADKPYSAVYIDEKKVLNNKSLKEFEVVLDPDIFIRVHRSSIINVNFISELKSRSNGDYDAVMKNGKSIRFSRHYRNNWKQLIQ